MITNIRAHHQARAAKLGFIALAGAAMLLALTRPASAQQPFDPSVYLPSADAMTASLAAAPFGIGTHTTAAASPLAVSGWDASSRYTVQEFDYVRLFDISVSVFPTQLAAAESLDKTAGDLLAENHPSREYPQSSAWRDHARQVRFNFTDPSTGQPDGSYVQLIREGCALVMINAHGAPAADFLGPAVDNDRALLLGPISGELDQALLANPAPCTG